jgi:leucyl aminopeptidase
VAEHPEMKVGSGSARADLVILPILAGRRPGPGAAEVETSQGINLRAVCRRHDVTGKIGDVLLIPGAPRSILLVGVGTPDEVDAGVIREAAQRAGRLARPFRTVASTIVQVVARDGSASAARAFTEGFLLGWYRYDGDKTSPDPNRTRSVLVLVDPAVRAEAKAGVARGAVTSVAVDQARDLVNAAPSLATPEALAAEAEAVARSAGLECRVRHAEELERGGFGGILAVGRGSSNPPTLVELAYRGGPAGAAPVAVTGKGVTFDSGGLDIKKPDEMVWMRSDMAGAAAALATMRAIAELRSPANVIAAIPFAENVPGASSYRPGDVIRHRGGVTSEVLDTDAEGRVMLADALAYLCERKPSVILDSATLTDAAGLGLDLFAVMGNDADAVARLIAAGVDSGERGWEIPLWAPYRHLIDSEVADVKNIGDHDVDSAMMAGLFLETFVDPSVPWVHVDSGSAAWAEYGTDRWPEGATGSPARAFIRFIETLAEPRSDAP